VCEFYSSFRDLLLPSIDALLEWFESTPIPRGVTHGDFCLKNILFEGDTVSGIIDWEWAQRDGFAQVDALFMLLGSLETNRSLAHYFRGLWADEIDDAALSARIAKICTQSGTDEDDLKFMALLLWFSLLLQNAMRGRIASQTWLEDMIPGTVPTMMKWLIRHLKTRGNRAITYQ
jgi:aminoglycoside phosphotransferase (APT) family kinase protein